MGDYYPHIPPQWSLAKLQPRLVLWICIALFTITMVIPALIIGLVLGLAGRSNGETIGETADLGYSKYQGVQAAAGVSHWFGIRYAAPPLGDLRFRAPRDPASTGDVVRPGDKHGAVCPFSPSTSLDASHSEDCLFLDVYAPTSNKGDLPVYVFIQGGGLNTLASPNMDGSKLIAGAEQDMVVVTFNYRVGPYGFLASKEVQANGDLNVGLLDQRKVFEWVQKYISKFGGDPKRVTIGGASAGAGSVDLHLTAYGGRNDNLFAAAIGESNSFGSQLTVSEAQYQYDALVKRVQCDKATDTIKCLRDLPLQTLAKNNPDIPTPGGAGGNPNFMWSNCIDGDFTRDYKYNMFNQGKFIKVPVIFGDDTNEGTVFTPSGLNNYALVNNFLKNNFPKLQTEQLAQIDHLYPKGLQFNGKATYFRTAADAYGDMRYTCPGITLSSAYDKAAVQQNFNYRWDVIQDKNKANGLGVTHTSEISAIWGSSAAGSADANFSPTIQSYWISFIRTSGDPNKHRAVNAAEWTRFDANSMDRVVFTNQDYGGGVRMESVGSDMKAKCDYLSEIGPSTGQ